MFITGPLDDVILIFLILLLIGGYSFRETLTMTLHISYYTFVLIISPILLYLVYKISADDKPVGADEDNWWQEQKEKNKEKGTGVHHIN